MTDHGITNTKTLNQWKIIGVIALIVIVFVFPLAAYKASRLPRKKAGTGPSFVGGETCRDCHKIEYDNWKGSHHDLAMTQATPKTVLGDFNNALFQQGGVTTRFFKKDEAFFVHTQGPTGQMAEFKITHTFGFHPLQQYLVPFPGGRMQCLTIAWDDVKKKWYALPNHTNDHRDWLHWTKGGQNWNGMCAECHSTNLKKGYDMVSDSFDTTWSEINVSCEACHGPGSEHVAWAQQPAMARIQIPNYNLSVNTRNLSAQGMIQICARCHSRHASIDDFSHESKDMMDYMIPSLLQPNLYHADGQILDEVYVYGSFIQSKMFLRGVKCNDCHGVHSLNLKQEENALCLACHRADIYDTSDHHFHKKIHEGKASPGDDCIRCHMPQQTYMGIDNRADHSIRIPRPDLSQDLGMPNACNAAGCHGDKDLDWTNKHMAQWYGKRKRSHFGPTLKGARQANPQALPRLISLAKDPLMPSIVRATALALLDRYPGQTSFNTLEFALMDPDALIRQTAIFTINLLNFDKDARLIFPLLYDQVKAVRIQAALAVAAIKGLDLTPGQKQVLDKGVKEYLSIMSYTADFPSGRYNMGLMQAALGQTDKAVALYEGALAIDAKFVPAQNNLAMLYNQNGDNEKAEILFKQILENQPGMYDIAYSLGLLLVEKKKYQEAATYLKQAASGLPGRARIHYNLGLLLQFLKKMPDAEKYLLTALSIEPKNLDFLYALADHYIKSNKLGDALKIAKSIQTTAPFNPLGKDIERYIKQQMQQ